MTTKIIDGKKKSQEIFAELSQRVKEDSKNKKRSPCLAVILLGDDPASKIYVSHKIKACKKVGFVSKNYTLPETTSEEEIIELIKSLNEKSEVDGILVQLPLPKHMNQFRVINHIKADKDVDGLTAHNQGMLALNKAKHIPCTPKGIMTLIHSLDYPIEGKIACVIGRSILVGSPMVKLLNLANSTVINIHSKTKNPKELCKQADIIVCAAGVPNLLNETWLKKDCLVIDVGIHRIEGKLCGDVDFDSAKKKARYITPVPGGVGPMTIASLLQNCYASFLEKNHETF